MVQLGDSIFKFLGVASVGWSTTGGAQSGTIVDDRFTRYPGCEPFAFILEAPTPSSAAGTLTISISGNTLTWRYTYAEAVQYRRFNCTFVYGIS